MLLSDTPRGQNWLRNFPLDEQAAARLLLDSILLVGQDALRESMTALIEEVANKLDTPIALIPVRELAPGQAYYQPGKDAKPRILLPNSFPGSEAIIASILHGVRRAQSGTNPFVAAPSLKNMRDARCKTVLLVDDFAGSGNRIASFLKGYRKHPTLRSWSSYGCIEYHVAVFSATPKAKAKLDKVFGPDNVHIYSICPTIANRRWEAREEDAVRKMCGRYQSSAIYCHALGYDATGALIAFSHSAPNNLPVILWQQHRAGYPGWQAFFNDKGVPSDIHSLFGKTDDERRRASALARMRQKNLASLAWAQLPSTQIADMVLVLAAASRRAKAPPQIAELTGLSVPDVERALKLCQGLQLIDRRLHLTDSGRAELDHARTIRLLADDFQLNGSTDPYYPQQLRAGR